MKIKKIYKAQYLEHRSISINSIFLIRPPCRENCRQVVFSGYVGNGDMQFGGLPHAYCGRRIDCSPLLEWQVTSRTWQQSSLSEDIFLKDVSDIRVVPFRWLSMAQIICRLSQFSSVAQAVSDSLRPHGLQQARLPCPSPTPGACSNSCSLSRWCPTTISSSVVPFSSCPQSPQHQGLL